jgi:predicted SprT family Zn-dependent metalloprotease
MLIVDENDVGKDQDSKYMYCRVCNIWYKITKSEYRRSSKRSGGRFRCSHCNEKLEFSKSAVIAPKNQRR